MSNETDRPTDHADNEPEGHAERRNPLDTDNVEKSVIQGPQRNPAAEVDPDAPGLSALGEQDGPPVEPNEPA